MMRITILKKKDFKLIGRALDFVKPYKLSFFSAILIVIAGIVLSLVQPLIWGNLLTRLFSKDYNKIIIFIIFLLSLYVLQAVFNFFQLYLFSFLNENIIYDMKNKVYTKIINLPVSDFDKMGSGTFMSRLHEDTAAITNIITGQLLNTIIDVLKVISIGILVFAISPYLAMITLISFPITYILFSKTGNVLKEKNKQNKKFYDNYYGYVQESIGGIREIKSLGIKDRRIKSFSELSHKMKVLNINMGAIGGFSTSLSLIINFLAQIVIYSVGAYLIYRGLLKMEYFIAFTSYSQQFSNALTNITKMNSNIQQTLVSLERILGLIDNLDYSQEEFGSMNKDEIHGNLAFNNIFFNYYDKVKVLENISFNMKANKKYAFIGLSGSGKTTIFNLIMRFYDPLSGNITIDDINIKEFSEESLRKHISIVRQEPLLFNISVKENLLLANQDVSVENIENACRTANIHEFIIGLPKGYDTIISEGGYNFSGGQKQRIAIARAILKGSKIILFDEATSSLDNDSEYKIKQTIDKLSLNHTVIIIAHRLLNIIDADEIFIIDHGKIVGQGSHRDLISSNEIYRELFKMEIDIVND